MMGITAGDKSKPTKANHPLQHWHADKFKAPRLKTDTCVGDGTGEMPTSHIIGKQRRITT